MWSWYETLLTDRNDGITTIEGSLAHRVRSGEPPTSRRYFCGCPK